MRKWVAAVAFLCVAAAVLWYWRFRPAPQPPVESPKTATPASSPSGQKSQPSVAPSIPATALATTNPAAVATNAGAPPVESAPRTATTPLPYVLGSSEAPPPGLAPETVLENMRTAIRSYGSMFKENPVGTNPEITAALNGGNPKDVKFINEEFGLRINGRGELVDSWGTPFFFHQLSATETEIRSAGPDKRMWTSDDMIIK
jgi:hypothetical protein